MRKLLLTYISNHHVYIWYCVYIHFAVAIELTVLLVLYDPYHNQILPHEKSLVCVS